MTGLRILSTGSMVPDHVVTNDDMAKIVDTSDEWIYSRTGIHERRLCDGETTLQLALGAAERAMQAGGIRPEQIGAVICATFTGETFVPSCACMLQQQLGLPEQAIAFDINAACCGFQYALKIAHGFLLQDPDRYVLVVAAESLSKVTDFTDRGTCVLFGDGAGAAVVALDPSRRFFWCGGSRGRDDILYCASLPPHGQTAEPAFVRMNGREVMRFALDVVPKVVDQLLTQAGVARDEVDWVLCHQANARIIASLIRHMDLPAERFYMDLEHYGNTSGATIALALDEMNREGLLKPGMKLVTVGFGGGLTWGAALIEW